MKPVVVKVPREEVMTGTLAVIYVGLIVLEAAALIAWAC
jgi:hypothetical protein